MSKETQELFFEILDKVWYNILMKQVVFLASLCAYSLVLAVVEPFSGIAAAQPSVQATQTIKPLICTVDIVAMGSIYEVQLTPAKCARVPEARQLLSEALAQYSQQ